MTTHPQQCIRVLVVDDEAAVLDAYRQVLGGPKNDTGRTSMQDLRARLFPQAGNAPAAPAMEPARTIEAVYCTGAEGAVAAVREACESRQRFSAAFIDMRMPPGPDGVWAAAQIRELDAEIEIVICTAYSDVDPAEIARRVPPEDKLLYLQKPFHPFEVRQMTIALAEKRTSIERRIAQLTHFDPLTGLPNRARFLDRLMLAVEDARRRGSRLTLLYLALDSFKRINDTLGFAVGDEFLCLAADRLRDALRNDDQIGRLVKPSLFPDDSARLGGDEFIILLRDLRDPQAGVQVAERLLTTLGQPTRLALHDVSVTASIGVAHFDETIVGSGDADGLFRNAGLAMYAAKRRGGGRHATFDSSMSSGAQMRLSLEGRLHKALARNELLLHYQPKFDLVTGFISGLEALLRWTNAELGTVSPMEFIPVAEETGLILPIGEWVLRTACTQVKAWCDAGLPTGRIAVNVSGLQFTRRDFPTIVTKVLKETGLHPSKLELEVTETLVMKDAAWARQALAELKRLGIALAIDDFGTGHSSLSRLRELPVDCLKIDRSFVRNIETIAKDRAIVTAIISMAKALDLQVVAEGVEDLAQLLFLQDEHCDQAQGYLLSRPLPVAETRLLLERLAASKDPTRTQRLHRLVK